MRWGWRNSSYSCPDWISVTARDSVRCWHPVILQQCSFEKFTRPWTERLHFLQSLPDRATTNLKAKIQQSSKMAEKKVGTVHFGTPTNLPSRPKIFCSLRGLSFSCTSAGGSVASPTNPAASARAARQANFRRSLASASGRLKRWRDEMHFPSQNPTNHDLLWLMKWGGLIYHISLWFSWESIYIYNVWWHEFYLKNMFPSDRSSFTWTSNSLEGNTSNSPSCPFNEPVLCSCAFKECSCNCRRPG